MGWTATSTEDVRPSSLVRAAPPVRTASNRRSSHQARWAAVWLGAIFVVGFGITLLGTFIEQGPRMFEFSPVPTTVLESLQFNAAVAAAGLTFVGVTIEAWIGTVRRKWRSVAAWALFAAATAAGGFAALVALSTVLITSNFTRVTVIDGERLGETLQCWLFVLCTYTPLALWLAWRNGGRLDRWFRARGTGAASSRR